MQTINLIAAALSAFYLFSCAGPTSESSLGDTTLLESGVKYIYLTQGSGEPVEAFKEITTNINLIIEDDTVWSTYGGQEFEFIAKKTSLIQGFDEVIMFAREGDRILAVIPPELGYGARGSGQDIPPNSTLKFDIDFLKVSAPRLFASDTLLQAWKLGGFSGLIGTYESIKDDTITFKLDDGEWYSTSVLLAENKAFDDIIKLWDYKLAQDFLLGGYYYKARAYDSLDMIPKAIMTLEEGLAKDTTNNTVIQNYLENLKNR
jgi:hypothetical protein